MKVIHWNKQPKGIFISIFILTLLACSSNNDNINETVCSNEPRMSLNKLDSISILNIYKAIGPWKNEWDLTDITTWQGVTVAFDVATKELRITELHVIEGSFDGELTEDIGNLSELRVLVLTGGNLYGKIPESIGNLKHLHYLTIANNNISGQIPATIGKLKELEWLRIFRTNVNGEIPESIGDLENLKYIHLYSNYLSGEIPKSLSKLKHIKDFWLDNNQLSGTFPIEILSTTYPIEIQCSNNNIEHLPIEIWRDEDNRCPPRLTGNKIQTDIPKWVTQQKKWDKFKYLIGKQQNGYGYKLLN